MGQLALLDKRAGTPASPVDHLLIGQHGVIKRVPINLGFLADNETSVEKIQKHPLLMLVVGGVARRDLARPIERKPHRLQLAAHGSDIGISPVRRMGLVVPGGVLGRHAKSVPTHRMQHVESARALIAGDHVPHRIIADMAHVDAAGRIGKHFQHVIFFARILVPRAEDFPFLPNPLPFGFRHAGVIALRVHGLVIVDRFGKGQMARGVIARSAATTQSRNTGSGVDCFASLAMTVPIWSTQH